MATVKIKFDEDGWDELAKLAIEQLAVPRMQLVADACNAADGLGDGGYMVSTEGDNPLQKRDFRATVITATEAAIEANARHNTLINEFHQAGD